jgi:hypothetical protein
MDKRIWITLGVTGLVCTAGPVALQQDEAIAAPLESKQPPRFDQHFTSYQLMDLDLPAGASEAFSTTVRLDGVDYTLELEPHTLRSPSFRVMVPRNGELIEVEAPAPVTMRGHVPEVPFSTVTAAVSNGQMKAMIRLDEHLTYIVQPASDLDPTADAKLHVAYTNADAIPVEGACGNIQPGAQHDHGHDQVAVGDAGAAARQTLSAPVGPNGEPEEGGQKWTTDIAWDADFEYYQRNGNSVSNTVADIETVMGFVQTIYERDVDICWNITLIIVRDQEPDPYSSTNHSNLLTQFRNHWNSQQTGNRTDHMHLATGKDIDGGVIGVANCIGCICSLSSSYALSQLRFTSVFIWRVGLVAHEAGHVYGGFHCCGGCSGCSTCDIMCPCISGCSGNVTEFGPQSVNSIVNHRNSRNCLTLGCGATSETVCPDSPGDWMRSFGGPSTGDASDLCTSNDVRLEIRQSAPVSPLLPFIRVDYWAHTALDGVVSRLEYTIECHVSALVSGGQNANTLRTMIRNYQTGSYENIDTRGTSSSSDETITHVQNTNASNYVQGSDGEIRVRQDVFNPGTVFSPNWFLKIDLYEVLVEI